MYQERQLVNQFIHIGNFSGDNDEEDLLEWGDSFAATAAALEWDIETKLKALPAYLTGTAAKWYRCCIKTLKKEEIPSTFSALQEKMVKGLAPSNYRNSLMRESNEKRQQPGQSAFAYAYDIRDLCRKINPEMREDLVHSFIHRGLNPAVKNRMDLLSTNENLNFDTRLSHAERSVGEIKLAEDSGEDHPLHKQISSLTEQLSNLTELFECLQMILETRRRQEITVGMKTDLDRLRINIKLLSIN